MAHYFGFWTNIISQGGSGRSSLVCSISLIITETVGVTVTFRDQAVAVGMGDLPILSHHGLVSLGEFCSHAGDLHGEASI